MHFDLFSETSKRQQCYPSKNPQPKCFKSSNFDRLHREVGRFCRIQHNVRTRFLAEYLNKTHILTCILKHLNDDNVICAKILT